VFSSATPRPARLVRIDRPGGAGRRGVLAYDHKFLGLLQKLANIQHENHKAIVSALHVHMDVHNYLELLVPRGRARGCSGHGGRTHQRAWRPFGKLVPATSGHGLE